MGKALTLAGLVAVLQGCAAPAAAWKGEVTWPDEHSARAVVEPIEAGAALAAAGAIREVVRTNPFPNLFAGCSSPEQGLDVSVFAGPTPGLYFVVVDQRFHRCGGPSGRVLDWWEVYAVTSQGEVVARAPAGEDPSASPPPVPAAPSPNTEAAPPALAPPPASPPPPTPEAPTPSVPPSPADPAPVPPAPAHPHPEGP
jgi:pyruvate/2-oxoglutarate dehydrogenase complex dihydrolipoamide acyltransferase (E2) component